MLDRGGDDVTTSLGTWDNGWEDGASWTLIGALGDGAVVVEQQSDGPADGLDGVSATVLVMAVRGSAWDKVYETSAPVILAQTSGDVATLVTCDQPAGKAPVGGGACDQGPVHYDGDGKTLELRWDGERVDERDVTPSP